MKSYTAFRAALYGVPLFLTPVADEIVPLLREDKWPSPMKWTACAILGGIAMCIGLRAYYDGSFQRSKDAAAPKEESNGMKQILTVILMAVLVLGAGCVVTGCASTPKGFGFVEVSPGADPVIVHAEWMAENGANAVDHFLMWERSHEAALLAENPAIHATADAVRDSAPGQLQELRRLTRQYKADKSDVNKGQVQAATSAVLAIVNAVRGQMKLPPIQPALAPVIFNTGGTNAIR